MPYAKSGRRRRAIVSPSAAPIAEGFGKLGAEQQDLRRVVDPNEDRHERARGMIGRGDTGAEIKADRVLADGEEERRARSAEPHVPPFDARIGQNLEHEPEEGGGEGEGEREVDELENQGKSGENAIEIISKGGKRGARGERQQ